MSTPLDQSILIVGGGPVGVTTALLLARQGVACQLLEAREQGAGYPDGRALALSYGTRQILEQLDVWEAVATKATPIQRIHISQKGSFGRAWLKAEDYALPALGYVVSYGALSQALDARLQGALDNVTVHYGAHVNAVMSAEGHANVAFESDGIVHQRQTPLAIVADGGRTLSMVPGLKKVERAYGHDAIVCKVHAEQAHQGVAYERFTGMGPVALLPNGATEFSLVWTGPSEKIQPLLALSDSEFLHALHTHFGDRVGQFLTVSPRMTFPLKLAYLDPACLPHLAVIGNAAQTMHPVAGQGFNVGLRDAYVLSNQVAQCLQLSPQALGEMTMLSRYLEGRARDTQRGLKFTDVLVKLFSNDIMGVSALRALGLGAFDLMPSVKHHVVSKMSFGG